MKWNTKYLLLRILASPFKLVFTVMWFNLLAIMIFFKWLKNGGQELYYGNAFGGNISTLIESNEKLLKALSQKEDNFKGLPTFEKWKKANYIHFNKGLYTRKAEGLKDLSDLREIYDKEINNR